MARSPPQLAMQELQQLQLLQRGDLQLALSIRPSTSWDVGDVERVGSIVQRRNQFVCMQLVTMVKEQFSKVSAATAAGDFTALHAASCTFLATLESVDCGSVLAAGLFYPRACSKGGSGMPHMYVELICCNSPGKGLGSCLLQHIEDFVAANCEAISAAISGSHGLAAGQAVGDAGGSPAAALTVDNSKAGISQGCGAGALSQQQQQQQPLGRQRRSVSHLPVVLPDAVSTHAGMTGRSAPAIPGTLRSLAGSSLSASNSSISSLASCASSSTCSNISTESGVLALSSMGSCASRQEATLQTRTPPLSTSLSGASGSTAAAAGNSSSSHRAPPPSSEAPSTNNSSSDNVNCNKIQGIKLLSVQSAQGFYTKCGYGAPDSCNEMFKPLSAMQQGLDAILALQQAV